MNDFRKQVCINRQWIWHPHINKARSQTFVFFSRSNPSSSIPDPVLFISPDLDFYFDLDYFTFIYKIKPYFLNNLKWEVVNKYLVFNQVEFDDYSLQ